MNENVFQAFYRSINSRWGRSIFLRHCECGCFSDPCVSNEITGRILEHIHASSKGSYWNIICFIIQATRLHQNRKLHSLLANHRKYNFLRFCPIWTFLCLQCDTCSLESVYGTASICFCLWSQKHDWSPLILPCRRMLPLAAAMLPVGAIVDGNNQGTSTYSFLSVGVWKVACFTCNKKVI